ncbi:hypothetical protein [Streptomyces sp. NBC_00199]|uniref:hypothetical protein n=1 Tax=Streptomyces sp. NBC_00199 TaxID=2975678 RepID=UPI00225643D9|nr:hypothetical protein [Streptomyces sp. NBC_00199]MCX5269964.1 hypothetical protein [Streptomyces sp. NBC_00199]
MAVDPFQQTAARLVGPLGCGPAAIGGADAEDHGGQVRALGDLQLRDAATSWS